MVGELIDFIELKSFIRESAKPFRDAVIAYLKLGGEKRGYVVRENSSVIKYGLTLGKIDVAWVDVKTIFFCEFAAVENIVRDLWLALEFNPEKLVFVLSGNSRASPAAVGKIIEESEFAAGLRGKTVLVDVSGGEIRSL